MSRRIDKHTREYLEQLLADIDAIGPAVEATIAEHGAFHGIPRALGKLQASAELWAAKLRAVLS